MKVITYGNPVLRKKAKKVKNIDKEIVSLTKKMFETMRTNEPQGVGLAAPQVGIPIALFVYELDDDKGVVINPEILERKGKETGEEGCLSVPGVFAPVDRAEEVVVRAINLKGKRIVLKIKGFKARVFQHEIDHLNGILFTDYVNEIDKFEVEEGYELPDKLIERFKK
ncbi:MAG: peptide deformylase [Caldisericaceae bacterium]|nr:peptide deformylase [Caldisericaceae bacterium]